MQKINVLDAFCQNSLAQNTQEKRIRHIKKFQAGKEMTG